MEKIRVYELAKQLNVSTKDLMSKLKDNKIEVKSHMSTLDKDQIAKVKSFYEKQKKVQTSQNNSKSNDENKKITNKNTEKTTEKISSVDSNKQNNSNKRFKPKHPRNNDEESVSHFDKIKHKNKSEMNEKRDLNDKKKNKNFKNNKNKNSNNNKNSKNNKNNKNNDHNRKDEAIKHETKEPKKFIIQPTITVKDLSEKISVSISELIMKLMELGIMANQNQEIDFDTASLVAGEFDVIVEQDEVEDFDDDDVFNLDFEDKKEDLKERPPVITVMGHVDHGKTSILDRIRNSRVAGREAGGITQHIGAYTIRVNDKKIVFLDTPGHEAFTAMRSRGAQVTDVSILVVAADDGVMPQTIEAINHSKAAGVPIIVAINKIDKENANIERVKTELAENGLVPEDWGGDTVLVPVSARTGEGIDDLLEMILMVAEMEELKANPNRLAVGTVIEAQLDKGRGPTATILVQKGTLKHSDMVFSGQASGRIRAMFNDQGKQVKKAGPSTPVLILGLNEVPEAGDMIYAVKDEKEARNYAQKIKDHNREEQIKSSSTMNLDELFGKISDGETKDLNIIIKTDVKGTIDAIKQSLIKLSNEEVKVNIIHGAVGGITESDVNLASASSAIIIGFNVRPTQVAMDMAKNESIEIRTYRVIYDAIEDVKNAITGMLKPQYQEEVLGRATVRDTFKVPGVGTVAGVYVNTGKVTRNATVRLLRDEILIFEGPVSSLKRYKDDVKELTQGYEGGMGLENYNDIKPGDVLEAYVLNEVQR
ncbi:MAG: translation initiation factor IF-2 [Finegoldia magna]|nr:translation initiation factor IF-2 [Finegoldia magna]KXA08854.1 translation initiation factor IF-2 [Finegoldia magna]MDU1213549.1 translation initiation factor IF-2 [Finegoldia magna]MDU4732478.1 translation initiation factor IF-2 [Finegoldia magna]MDU5185423.1 translation initiation factor IF-2 [Finegoldia magna]MDU6597818.1 translation initiation factor IF-2 [Finegoldia magna]